MVRENDTGMRIEEAREVLGFGREEQRYSLGAIERAAHVVALDSVRKLFADFQTSRLFFNENMARSPKADIQEYLDYMGADEAVLDETGERSAEEMRSQIDRAEKRALFVADIRQYVHNEIGNDGGYASGTADRILGQIMDACDAEIGFVILDGVAELDGEEKRAAIRDIAGEASYAVAIKKYDELIDNENCHRGSDMERFMLEEIKSHLDYASNGSSGMDDVAAQDFEDIYNDVEGMIAGGNSAAELSCDC